MSLEEQLRIRAGRLLHGMADDVARYAAEMASDLSAAKLLGDQRALEHLAAQAKLLGAKHKLKASTEAWAAVADLVLELGSAASDAAQDAAEKIDQAADAVEPRKESDR